MMSLVELMLDVAAFPDDTICSMSFNFWTSLVYELTGQMIPQSIDGICNACIRASIVMIDVGAGIVVVCVLCCVSGVSGAYP